MRDRTLNALHQYLAKRVTQKQLRELGWYDLRKIETLDEDSEGDEVATVYHAFVYLCIVEGKWNEAMGVLYAVIAFLMRNKVGPTSQRIEELKSAQQQLVTLLKSNPVDLKSLNDWFDRVFR